MKNFSVIGTGRLGTCLAAALAQADWAPIRLIDRDPKAAAACRKIVGSGRAGTSLERIGSAENVIILSVPDDRMADVALEAAKTRADWSGLTVFHTSGILGAEVLRPFKRRGAATASLHPIQSFPRRDGNAEIFRGIFWAVQGDQSARTTAREIIVALGGNLLSAAANDKAAIHVASSLASNALVALENAAISIMAETGLSETRAWAVLAPLVAGTLRNMTASGPRKALSGPAVRGDVGTIEKHMASLSGKPVELGIYTACLRKALELIPEGAMPAEKIRAMKRLAGRK